MTINTTGGMSVKVDTPQRLSLTSTIPPMADFPSTKDISYHPLFRGMISKYVWKLLTVTITRTGRWFLAATLLFGAAASISLQVQPYVLLAYAFGIWFIATSFHLCSRPRVKLTARHSDRVCVGETLPVDVEVVHTGRRTLWDLTVLPHGLPPAVDAMPGDGVHIDRLDPRERTRVRLGLRCRSRGMHRLRGYRAESDFPLGLLRSYTIQRVPQTLLVYPRFHALGRLAIPTGRRFHPGGVALASNLGESFEFLGNREYQEGDNVRDIDWRATARLSNTIIREYREEYYLRVGIVLDTFVTGDRGGERTQDFERAVSMAAAVGDYMSRQDYIVDIFAAGPDLYHLTAGRSLAYLDQILDILAVVDQSHREPFETLEPAILENLSKITTLICVFLDWNPARQAFVERMALAGAGIKVIVVRDSACTDDPSNSVSLTGPIPVIGRRDFDAGIEEM